MKKAKFERHAQGATSIEEVLVAFDGVFDKDVADFGVSKEKGVSINAARKLSNQKALEVLQRVNHPSALTEEDRAALRAYTGEGGIGGSTSEYYTPTFLAKGVYNALQAYGLTNGNLCEPSCGTGVFNATKPEGMIITGAEISETSSRINQLLHPEDQINHMPFESLAMQTPDNHFDAFIGNVPFGDSRSEFANLDPEYKHVKTIEEYFLLRAVDKVKHGGYLTMVVPTQIISTASLKKFRAKLSRKAEFLGAHRIPSGTFEASGSASVVTDVIVLRKHSEEMMQRIADVKHDTLTQSNVLWDEFIQGKYFEGEGRKFVHGEIAIGAGNFGTDLVKIPNLPTVEAGQSRLTDEQLTQKQDIITSHNQSIAKKLAHKFESRIDWDYLSVAEPVVINYVEGDRRIINGRWHELTEGDWVLVPLTATNGLFDKALYGRSDLDSITRAVSSPSEALGLEYHQLMTIHDTLQDKCSSQLVSIIKMSKEAPLEHQERVVRGALIGSLIQDYLHDIDHHRATDAQLTIIQQLLTQMYDTFGSSKQVKGLGRLRHKDAALYNLFAGAMNEQGEFSDLIAGKLTRESIVVHDKENPRHVIEKLSMQGHNGKVTFEEFRAMYTGKPVLVSDSELMDYLAQQGDIAITPEGDLATMERATSGNIATKRAGLRQALADESFTDAQKRNFVAQLEHIDNKRKWSDAKRIDFGLRARWIPRQLVKDFLHENGFSKFEYVSISQSELGDIVEDTSYTGNDGIFTGYYTRNGKKVSASDKDKQFAAQLEKYLNGFEVQSKDNQASSKYRSRIRRLEKAFQRWLRQHGDIDDVVAKYNDTFNGEIPLEHLDTELSLQQVSGEIVLAPYQNSAVRRLSEEGSGILGFGTGLGKTFTALALAEFDRENKRARRTCIVVPKAVMENWIYESVQFYGYDNLDGKLFVGFAIEYDKEAKPITEPMLNDKGKVKLNPVTGNPIMRPKLRERSSEEIAKIIHEIPHSSLHLVVMTKEQFASIPLKQETLIANAGEHIDAHQSAGLVDMYADNYRAKAKLEKLHERLLDDGSTKAYDLPYMEDLNFDKVIADEGHNYRNSQEAGRQSRKLMYMAAGNEAKIAADMRQKLEYLKRKQNGRGAVMLTATPTPNSPVDAYNMLSHVMRPSDWQALGIVNQDDFIQEFGEVEEVSVNRLNGETAMAQGLVGFKNLDGLRSIFHRFINKKDADDVGANVKVPDVIPQIQTVELTNEQKKAYELLRFRAELISQKARGEDPYLLRSDKEIELIESIEAKYPDDQLFSVIRDMDRVTTDIELFKRRMTFVFSKRNAKKAQALVDGLPTEKKMKVRDKNEHGETVESTITAYLNAQINTTQDGLFTVSINEQFEGELLKGLKSAKLTQKDITHPVSPKYAKMIEQMQAPLADGGKVLVFSEEKSQHKKLHRILCHHLGLEPNQVGILNGDTVVGIESASNDENHKKLSKAKIKALAQDGELVEEAGLEAIAKRYNEGKYRVLILNKKGEVGVNLHIGTTDIFHATLPWNPASIDQRDGRGARVGAPQEEVNSHYLIAKGSFDLFRKETIDRKRKWQKELFDGDDVRVANGDAENELDAGALLAANPEEYKAKQAEAQRQLELKMRAELQEDAQINLHRFIEASTLSLADIEQEERKEQQVAELVEAHQGQVDKANERITLARREFEQAKAGGNAALIDDKKAEYNYFANALRDYERTLSGSKSELNRQRKRLGDIAKAQGLVKSLAPEIENAIDEGLLHANKRILSHPSEFAVNGERVYKLHGYYKIKSTYGDGSAVVKITSMNNKDGSCTLDKVYGDGYYNREKLSRLGEEVSYSEEEIDLRRQLAQTRYSHVAALVDASQFYHYLSEGALSSSMSVYLHDGGDFKKEDIKQVDASAFGEVVYPSPDNSALKQQVALLYINKKKAFEKTDYLDGLAQALFGDNYYREMATYNDNPTTKEDVATWLATKHELLERRHRESYESAVQTEAVINYTDRMKRMMWNVQASAPDVLDAYLYEQAVEEHVKALQVRFEADYASYFKTMSDRNAHLITQALSDNDEDIKSRLRSLGKGLLRLNFTDLADFTTKLERTAYTHCAPLFADLISAGYEAKVEGSSYALTDSQLQRAFSSLWYKMKYDRATLDNYVVKASPKVSVTTSPSVPVEVDADSLEVLPYAQALADIGVVAKRNSRPATFKSRRGKVYRQEDEYAIVGLFDSRGKGGQLFAAKEPLKALCNAKYVVDLSDEFAGSWWIISAEVDADTVLKAFGLAT